MQGVHTYLHTCAEVDRDVEQEEDIETSRDVVERVGGGLAEVRLETDLVILVVRSRVVVKYELVVPCRGLVEADLQR